MIVTHRAGFAPDLPEAFAARMRRIPGVVRVSPYLYYGGTYGEAVGPQDQFSSMATDGTEDPRLVWGDQLVVEPGTFERWKASRTAAVVGSRLLRSLP